MLSNLSAGSFIAEDTTINFSTYLRSLKEEPKKLVRLLAILIVPSAALGWWYYSLAMSVGAVAPLGAAVQTSQEILISAPENAPASPADSTAESSSASSISTGNIDVKINSNSSQTGAVEVDGQSIPIPADGSTHQIIQNDNGKTTIDINVDSDTTGTSKSRSSTNINLRSSSDIDVDIKSKEVQ